MRAFNLIDALCKTGQLRPGVSVAVVGGGIAGLTAAAAAAVRGANVTLIESGEDFCPIQSHPGTRYLHPHIYDWPLYESKNGLENKADFPFLDWQADDAEIVFRKLRENWDSIFTEHAGRLHRPTTLMETRLTDFKPAQSGAMELTLETKSAGNTESTTRKAELLILALGFGREMEGADLQRYWEKDPFDAVPAHKLRWLVSGSGDGGLTDLMRLCIKDFRHDEFVEKYEADAELAARLRELLTNNKGQSVRAVFDELFGGQVDPKLFKLRSNTEVVLNAEPNYLESRASSILNKLIVYQLEKLGKFTLQGGWLKLPIPTPDQTNRQYKVEFTDKNQEIIKTEIFDRLIIRHGPQRPISKESFPEFWPATEALQKQWESSLSQSEDRTRVQIWDPADYVLSTSPNPIANQGEAETQVNLRCVIVESTNLKEKLTLSSWVKTAVNTNKKAISFAISSVEDVNITTDFDTIKVNEALSSQKGYNRAVSLLCKADVAVIDVTRYEPGVMLLLGLRSAVRRGVTIVTTNLKLDSTEWSNLPFNLKELYPISLSSGIKQFTDPGHPTQVLKKTIGRALTRYYSLPFYQDVPAYEAVRRFDPPPKDEAQRILWLCSFHPSYEPYADYIQSSYLDSYGSELDEHGEFKFLLERITEIVSPQVVTQKLYSAIRGTARCVIDWTFWSPNVFFELGVRLAVSNFGPVCLLATDSSELGTDPIAADVLDQREKLKKLFRPLEYTQETNKEAFFREIRARFEEMMKHDAGSGQSRIPPTFGAFPFDHTYKSVGEYLPLKDEPGAWGMHDFLNSIINSLIGSDPTDPMPVLFANVNKDLDNQARTAAKEVLIAAWYYLSNRYKAEWLEPGDKQEAYSNLSTRLANLLRESDDPKDQELRQFVRKDIKTLKDLKKGKTDERIDERSGTA